MEDIQFEKYYTRLLEIQISFGRLHIPFGPLMCEIIYNNFWREPIMNCYGCHCFIRIKIYKHIS